MRRILLLITDLEIGGTPTVVRELAKRLGEGGAVEIEVACLKAWGPNADRLRAASIPVTAFDLQRAWQLPSAVRRLRELVRQRQIDTVFSFLIHANLVGALASRELPDVRFFQSIQTTQPRPRWHWWLQARIHGAAQQIVVPSSAVARIAEDRCGVPHERVRVIPNALDPDEFPSVPVFQEQRRIRVGFLGRLDPVKNVDWFIQNIGFALPDYIEGHIFGEGPERANLDKVIAWFDNIGGVGMPLSRRIVFHGAVARPQDALRQMDLLFFPSTGEGFGLVVIEAMASGVPVAAVPFGGIIDIITDGYNGRLLRWDQHPYRDLGPQLGRFIDALREPAHRQTLIENALKTVREKFTWNVVLPQYRSLLGL